MKTRTGVALAAVALALAGGTGWALIELGESEDEARARDTLAAAPLAMSIVGDDDDLDDDDEEEFVVPLGRVPEHVLAAALEAVPGLELEAAEAEREDGVLVYDLEGVLDGREIEVEVTEDGDVLEIEYDDEDND